jgi:tetratricopeptide (TPR) repeat protein
VRSSAELSRRLATLLLCAAAVLCTAAPASANANDDARDAASKGLGLLTTRQYDEAIKVLEKAQELCRRKDCQSAVKADVYLALGIAHGLKGDGEKARIRFEWALSENPTATPDERYLTRTVMAAYGEAQLNVEEGAGSAPPRPAGEIDSEQKQNIESASKQLRNKDWEGCLQTMIVSLSGGEYAAGKLMLAKCQDMGGLLIEARRDAEMALELAKQDGDEQLIEDIGTYFEQLEVETPKIRLKIQRGIRNPVVKIDDTVVAAEDTKKPIPHNPGTAVVEVNGTRGGQPYKFRQEIRFQRRETIDLQVRSDVTPYQACLKNARTLGEKEECERIFNVQQGLSVKAGLEVTSYNDNDNVDVLSPSLSVVAVQPTDGWNVGGTVLVDVVSTASADIVSTASRRFDDVRFAASLGGGYKIGPVTASVDGSFSYESDYVGRNVGATLGTDLFDKMVSPYVGYNFGLDLLGRADTDFEVFSRDIYKHTISAGTSVIFDDSTVGMLAATAVIEDGDTSKPYRHVAMFPTTVIDDIPEGASRELVAAARLNAMPLEQLPDNRQRYAVLLRLAHRFDTVTLRGSERVYLDSWDQWASSTDARLFWDFYSAAEGDKSKDPHPMLTLGPHLRFHVQGPVAFWQRAYVAVPGPNGFIMPQFRTGDRELGPMLALTFGLGLKAHLTKVLSLGLQAEGIYSRFLDHLYVFDRWGVFTASTLEIEID